MEVLITLGIIGIVAAMTLPALINKYREQEIITRVKKTYTSIAQALELVQAHYGTPGDNGSLFSSDKDASVLTKELSEYFNGAKYCEANSNQDGCENTSYKLKLTAPTENVNGGNLSENLSNYPRIVFNNGAILAIVTQKNSCAATVYSGLSYNSDGSIAKNPDGSNKIWTETRAFCGRMFFDVNGKLRPNQFGRDAYRIDIYKNRIGDTSWNVYGTESLHNILMGKKNPFVYEEYDADGEFEW